MAIHSGYREALATGTPAANDLLHPCRAAFGRSSDDNVIWSWLKERPASAVRRPTARHAHRRTNNPHMLISHFRHNRTIAWHRMAGKCLTRLPLLSRPEREGNAFGPPPCDAETTMR